MGRVGLNAPFEIGEVQGTNQINTYFLAATQRTNTSLGFFCTEITAKWGFTGPY